MTALAWGNNRDTYDCLMHSYTEKHRHYHDISHIKATLIHLDQVRALAQHAPLIELALWFHDVIYKPFSSTNEADSAQWARRFMEANQSPAPWIKEVEELIMITQHDGVPKSDDEKLMVDIDLGILGSPQAIYQRYEKQVRKEYRWVPWFIYRKKRAELLRSFLARDQIYSHAYFQEQLTSQAQRNLEQAIQDLQK